MAKRFITLLITMCLLVGTSGLAAAAQRDFEHRGSYDYPPRLIGYVLFPVGMILDWLVVRPITFAACTAPSITGCTEDERDVVGLEHVDQELPSE